MPITATKNPNKIILLLKKAKQDKQGRTITIMEQLLKKAQNDGSR